MNLTWYETLNKPPYTPPAEIFTPAWVILYTMIFVSFILYCRTKTFENKTSGYIVFFVQLLLNFLWSPVFFYWKNIEISMIIIILLIAFVILTMFAFFRVSKLSGLLLIPYLLWLCFAAYLNYGFMVMN